MIQVVAKHVIRPDGVDEFIRLSGKLVEETVKNDAGCLRYELFQDLSDPRVLTIIEEWEDKQALDRHLASKHFQEAAPRLAGLAERPGEVNLYRKLC